MLGTAAQGLRGVSVAYAQIRYGLLGSVTAWRDGREIPLGAPKQQAVLVALLLEMNHPVPVHAIIDGVWGEHPPGDARNAVQLYVGRLRRALGVSATECGSAPALVWGKSGYVLHGDSALLDSTAFDRYLADAERCRGDGDPAAAADRVDRALALWRGEPFSGLTGPIAEAERRRLHERRLVALEQRAALGLARGLDTEAVAELTRLVATYPLQERFRALLMLGLYRCGRQADALQVFQDARRRLADELGIEPGPELCQLNQQILCQDIDRPPASPGASWRGRNELPSDIADFTGREPEMSRLLGDLPAQEAPAILTIEAIDGMAGIGKTALAVHAAHRLSDRYPDAQLFIDLHGYSADRGPVEPIAALDTLLRAVGVPAESIPDDLDSRAALWRARLADRAVLVVLDNAADADQVRPLLPGATRSLVLITSRRRLVDLDGGRVLSLDVLPERSAIALFAAIVDDDRIGAEPEAVADAVRLCGYLPLAIRIAAGRLRARPAWSVGHQVERLRCEHRLLDELTAGTRGVAAALATSYRELSTGQQHMFRLLGLHLGRDIEIHGAAALADVDVVLAEELLESLLDVHLVEQVLPGRYRLHDLVREHAARLAHDIDSESDRDAATTRLLDHAEHFSCLLFRHYVERGYSADESIELHSNALEIARISGKSDTEARMLAHLGFALWRAGRLREALTVLGEARRMAHAVADFATETHATHHAGLIHFRWSRYPDALTTFDEACALARRIGDPLLEGYSLHGCGLIHERMGNYETALELLRQAVRLARTTDIFLQAHALGGIGETYCSMGRYEDAVTQLSMAAELLPAAAGGTQGDNAIKIHLGRAYCQLGQYEQAWQQLRPGLALARGGNDPVAECWAALGLGQVHTRLEMYTEAVDHYERACALGRSTESPYEQALAHDGLAVAYQRLARPGKFRAHRQRAVAIAIGLHIPRDRIATWHPTTTYADGRVWTRGAESGS